MNIKQKRQEIAILADKIKLHNNLITKEKSGRIQYVQDALEHELRELEERGMDKKIEAMNKVLNILNGQQDNKIITKG